jgi:hypothetical protein
VGGSVEGGRGPKAATCMCLSPIYHDAPRGPAPALLLHAALRKGGVPCLLGEGLRWLVVVWCRCELAACREGGAGARVYGLHGRSCVG